jgi:hypothetical protein
MPGTRLAVKDIRLDFLPADGEPFVVRIRTLQCVPWLDPATGQVHLGYLQVQTSDVESAQQLEPGVTGTLEVRAQTWGTPPTTRFLDTFGPVRVAHRLPSGDIHDFDNTAVVWTILFEPIRKSSPVDLQTCSSTVADLDAVPCDPYRRWS